MATLNDLHAFDIAGADASVWVFKTSTATGVPKFTGHWIGISDELNLELKEAVAANRAAIVETLEYDLLALNEEGSALTLPTDETYAPLIVAAVANETPARKVKALRHLANSKFYAIKLVSPEGTLLAIRKTDNTWSSKKTAGLIKMVYSDDELDVDNDPTFTVQPFFDFYILDDRIFILSKPRFESVLLYKAGHTGAFQTLIGEPEFTAIFSDVAPINDFVGANKIRLRRAIAIQQKGHYRDQNFMANLRQHHVAMGLNIQFDAQGRIVATPETCRDIFQALLNFRLDSRLSGELFDVQHSEPIA
jgi:hypothetical protein